MLAFTVFLKGLAQDLEQQPSARLNRDIRRRTHVAGIFLDRDALIRLLGAVLAEQRDECTDGRRYLGLDVFTRGRLRSPTYSADTEEVTIPALSA